MEQQPTKQELINIVQSSRNIIRVLMENFPDYADQVYQDEIHSDIIKLERAIDDIKIYIN